MDNTEKARELINKHLYLRGGDGLGITDGDVYRAVLDAVSEALHIGDVSVPLPSVDDAGVIAVAISEINNEITAQEQAFFVAGFQECVKYLEMQSNER